MNIWNVSFALLVAISLILICGSLGDGSGVGIGLILGGIWFIVFITYSSKYKVGLSPLHLVAGFGILFFALFGSVYRATFDVPTDWQKHPLQDPFDKILSFLGIPDSWLYLPAVLYLFIVPLLTILAIVEGFMGVFKEIFGKWTHIIAGGITLMTIPFGIFTRIVQSMFAAMGLYSIGAFAFLFVFGVIAKVFEGLGKMKIIGAETLKGAEADMEAEATYTSMRSEVENAARNLITAGRGEGGEKGAGKIRAGGKLLGIIAKADIEAEKKGYRKAIDILSNELKKMRKMRFE
ncbi:MAG: hypothetical protein QXP77_00015 [Candidatus Aenigmatarchaeota archaeon]